MKAVLACFLLFLLDKIDGDVYLHYPRGSNNRLNERSAQRRNGNRVFDSQVSYEGARHSGNFARKQNHY